MKAFGSPNSAPRPSRSAAAPRRGLRADFRGGGRLARADDIKNARCLVLIGSHLGENMHNTQVQEFADAVGSGATVIVADPASRSRLQGEALLPIKPGTDLALLLAWMNVLVREGSTTRSTSPRTASASRPSPRGPALHAGVGLPETGIEPDVIRETARRWRAPPGDPRPPRAPRDLVRGRRAAQPRDRPPERAPRQLGEEGRLLPAGQHERARLPLSALPEAGEGKVDNPDHRYPSPARRSPRVSARPPSPGSRTR